MTYRPTAPRHERKLYRACELVEAHQGRQITVGGEPWVSHGQLVSVEPDRAGLLRITVRLRDGRPRSITVPDDTAVLVHRRKESPPVTQ